MAISLQLRQELLAADTTYVAVNEILSVSGIAGAAASDISRAFVIGKQNSGKEIYKQIVDIGKMDSTAYSPLNKLKLIPNTFDWTLLPSTSAVTIQVPKYWETKHFGTVEASSTGGTISVYGDKYKLSDILYAAFSPSDVGKKISITTGSNIGIYPIVTYINSESVVIDGAGASLTPENASWDLISFSFVNVPIISVSNDVIWLSKALPSQTPDPDKDYLVVDLLDSSGVTIQGAVKAVAVREDDTLLELRDSVFYSFHGSSKAAEDHNASIVTMLKSYVADLNIVGSAIGRHTVTTITI